MNFILSIFDAWAKAVLSMTLGAYKRSSEQAEARKADAKRRRG